MLSKPSHLYRRTCGLVPKTQVCSRRLSLPRVQPSRGLPSQDDGFGVSIDGFSAEAMLGMDADFAQSADMDAATSVTDAVTQSAPTAAAAATTLPIDFGNIVSSLDVGVSNMLQGLPEPLQGVLSTVAHDIIGLMSLDISFAGGLRLAALYYMLFTRPSPISAIVDYYILRPVSQLAGAKFSENDFTLRDRLGNGNYGQGMCVCVILFDCFYDIF